MTARSFIYDQLRQRSPSSMRSYLKRQRWFFPLLERVFGSTAYSSSYYADVVRLERVSVPHIADWILQELHPKRVIDVGCGPGHLMQELADRGMEVFGVDVSDEAARLVGERGLPFAHVDITSYERVHAEYFDLAISCEVAEHLKPAHAATFVARMVELADTVYVTAAEPMPNGETGLYHFNEQPNCYWIELFGRLDFAFDEICTASCRDFLSRNGVISYLAKPMIFRKVST